MKHYYSLFILFLICILPSQVAAKPIADLQQIKWATPYIQNVVNQGIMPLSADQRFRPGDRVKRQEAVQIITKALALPLDAKVTLQAKDVATTHPQYKAFRKLIELGVLDNAQYLKPDGYMTRAQIAKIIALSFQIQVDNKNIASFRDVTTICWAKDYIESLADVGVFHGKSQDKFAPFDTVSRAQLAKIIIEAQLFKKQLAEYEVAYDYLGKRYLMTPQSYPKWATQTVELINQYRSKNNIPLLKNDPELTQLATIKAGDMVERQYFNHNSPYYGQAWDQASLFGYEFISIGENLAMALTSPQEAVKAWLASNTHRENILNHRYTHTGVAIVKDSTGKYYWVQLFSSK